MKCPYCGKEMEEGGLIVNDIAPGWIPLKQFNKKGMKRLVYSGLCTIGKTNILIGQTKIPNAFFCQECNKIVGIFDISNKLDD